LLSGSIAGLLQPNPDGLHQPIGETVSTTTHPFHAMRVCENGVAKVKASGIIARAAQPDPAGKTENEIRRDETC
jgi:hypothetical protein